MKGGQQTQNLTQQEYVIRINEMSKEMIQAWKNDQRVKTLKIVIQVREKKKHFLQSFFYYNLQACKLLVDMNVLEFYPSKFCLITDLLDTFGKISKMSITLNVKISF